MNYLKKKNVETKEGNRWIRFKKGEEEDVLTMKKDERTIVYRQVSKNKELLDATYRWIKENYLEKQKDCIILTNEKVVQDYYENMGYQKYQEKLKERFHTTLKCLGDTYYPIYVLKGEEKLDKGIKKAEKIEKKLNHLLAKYPLLKLEYGGSLLPFKMDLNVHYDFYGEEGTITFKGEKEMHVSGRIGEDKRKEDLEGFFKKIYANKRMENLYSENKHYYHLAFNHWDINQNMLNELYIQLKKQFNQMEIERWCLYHSIDIDEREKCNKKIIYIMDQYYVFSLKENKCLGCFQTLEETKKGLKSIINKETEGMIEDLFKD